MISVLEIVSFCNVNELRKPAPSNLLFAGPRRAIPSGQDEGHLARSGSQSEHRIRFILPARGASHIIKIIIIIMH